MKYTYEILNRFRTSFYLLKQRFLTSSTSYCSAISSDMPLKSKIKAGYARCLIIVFSIFTISTMESHPASVPHICQSEDFKPCYGPHSVYLFGTAMGTSAHLSFAEVDIQGSRALGGFSVGYQYLNPGRLYANIDGTLCFSGSALNIDINNTSVPVSQARAPAFIQMQLRLGLPIVTETRLIVPYFGIGWLGFGALYSSSGLDTFSPYLAWGVRMPHLTARLSHLGLDLALLGPIYNYLLLQETNFEADTGSFNAGIRISFPYTIQFSQRLKWDLRLEPFFIAPDFSGEQLFYGASLGFLMHF